MAPRQSRRGRLRLCLLLVSALLVSAALHLAAVPPQTGWPAAALPLRRLQQASSPAAAPLPTSTAAPNVSDNLFPTDLFTPEQRANGAVVLHILGMIYMFFALALVCDEFFVPSLDVITEKLDIGEDVAGATFMAAGGSAPELFTSIIGIFIAKNDVGIGTIVGSAVFNILFVIAMCVMFSRTVLVLTWWPLFRDVTFYSIGLLMLVVFFTDNKIHWWEALIMFSWYISYCTFMKFNSSIERWVKTHIVSKRVGRVKSSDQISTKSGQRRRPSTPSLHTGSKFRQGLLQLMIHTIDPLHAGKLDDQATHLHAIASLNVLLEKEEENARDNARTVESGETQPVSGAPAGHESVYPAPLAPVELGATNISTITASNGASTSAAAANTTGADEADDDDEVKPIDLSWPDTFHKRVVYIIVAPIIFVLWITLPDCKSPRGRRFFAITFLGSIMWIAVFSYLMVWWASVMADTMNIPDEVVGLTILAAGTSVPDLITSVIVARKGFGDMAVSSSVGSNLFDICVGLPVPWMLDSLVKVIQQLVAGTPVSVIPTYVKSEGMTCSILLLFSMLMLIIVSIACFNWKMNKGLGVVMFFLYFVFVAISLCFELDVITCYL